MNCLLKPLVVVEWSFLSDSAGKALVGIYDLTIDIIITYQLCSVFSIIHL
jgi:hypothetical protein